MRGLAGGEMIKHIMFRENTEEQKKRRIILRPVIWLLVDWI